MPGFGFGARAAARRRLAAGAPTLPVIMAVLAGQSNMEGRQDREAQDVDVAGAAQYIGDPNQAYRTISTDITPLYGPYTTQDLGAAGSLGPGEYIARQLLADNAGAAIVLVPTQRGSTFLIDGDRQWISNATPGAGGPLFENMIGQANAAYAAIQAAYPGRPIRVQLYWVQGEFDADGINNGHAGISRAAYRTALTDVVTRFRARVTGAASAPVTIGSMVPERWDAASPNKTQGFIDINAAHVDLSVDMAGVRYARGPYYTQAEQDAGTLDFLHYRPARRVRVQGLGMGAALSDTGGPTMTSGATAGTSVGAKLALTLTCDDPHATFHLDGGADAALFEVSDRYFTPTLRWAGDGTGPAAGSYAVNARARDGSGNYGASQPVTLTVAGAYGDGDQGPITATYLGHSIDPNIHFGGSFTIDNVPLGVGLNLLMFRSDGGSGRVYAVTGPGGTSGTVFLDRADNQGTDCQIVGLVSTVAGSFSIACLEGGGNSIVSNVTVDVVVMTGTKRTPLSAVYSAANTNPPWSDTIAPTIPASGMQVVLGLTPSATRTVTGATVLSGSTSHGGTSFAATKTGAAGTIAYDGGSGLYEVANLVFEKSA